MDSAFCSDASIRLLDSCRHQRLHVLRQFAFRHPAESGIHLRHRADGGGIISAVASQWPRPPELHIGDPAPAVSGHDSHLVQVDNGLPFVGWEFEHFVGISEILKKQNKGAAGNPCQRPSSILNQSLFSLAWLPEFYR